MDYEIQNIFYADCYGLTQIEGNVDTILDIGGNLGFFSLAARSHFPDARIHSYEPNPAIQKHLMSNTRGLSIRVFPEAIGAGEGRIEMKLSDSSLFATTVNSATGHIKKTALATTIKKIGGKVDLLKLDCEGAEWELFEHKELWEKINHLTLEYHLWAVPEMDVTQLVEVVKNLGFRITHLNESSELKWGMLHASKK